jgi:DNA end-binding protein Ku
VPRSLWKGSISFGLVQIPIQLYSAEARREEIHFHLLDKRDMAQVGYTRYNKATGEKVPESELVKGYEYEKGSFVKVEDQDFARANPKATHAAEILDFVDQEEIDAVYYDRPYYCAPEKNGFKAYALLRETLKRKGKIGIARAVIRTKEYLAAIYPQDDVLVLNLLRWSYEVSDPSSLELPSEDLKTLGVHDKELEIAATLVDSMASDWVPEKYEDHYRSELLALIEEKARAGGKLPARRAEVPEEETGGKVVDLMALLKKSVEQSGGVKAQHGKPKSRPAEKRSRAHATKARRKTKKAG